MEEKKLDTIQNDHVVQIAYNLNVEGEEVESDLLEYLHGHGNIIPGLEDPLTGAKVGDTLEVIAKAEDAYGEFDPDSVITVSRESFPADFEIHLGEAMRLRDAVEALRAELAATEAALTAAQAVLEATDRRAAA